MLEAATRVPELKDGSCVVLKKLGQQIWVSLRAAESISDRIQKLRDEELQPQLVDLLLQGFTKSLKLMVNSHETQRQIIFLVNLFTCPAYGKFCNDAQRHATLKLEVEIRNWRSCFVSYVNAQKAYIEALDGWLSKFILIDTGTLEEFHQLLLLELVVQH
ncbi:unnamed protein product [Urochloa humidicola]